MMKRGCPFGSHRVIEPKGTLPQPAWRIDNTMEPYDNEILVRVQTLNIDAASFTQIEEEARSSLKDGQSVEDRIAEIILDIVGRRGKQHNPVTGSGGMFIGTVEWVGEELAAKKNVKVGDRIASLVSLSLTPLKIDRIVKVHVDKDQVDIEGHAILFESGVFAKLPEDIPDKLALAVLDVAGAPAQTAKLVKPGQTVFIIGAGGKSGLLCTYEAKKRTGITGKVIAMGHSKASCDRVRELGCADIVFAGDATKPVEVMNKLLEATGGERADVTINCVNIPDTEMSSILATKDDGVIYFFSMATSFTKAALGAEGIGSDALMIIGNGYTRGHDQIALNLMRESGKLRAMFERLFLD